jgi:hypothetical protein
VCQISKVCRSRRRTALTPVRLKTLLSILLLGVFLFRTAVQNRGPALRRVFATAMEATADAVARTLKASKSFGKRRSHVDIIPDVASQIRTLVWQPNALKVEVCDRLVLDGSHDRGKAFSFMWCKTRPSQEGVDWFRDCSIGGRTIPPCVASPCPLCLRRATPNT